MFSDKLKSLRRKKGITQKELSEIMDVSLSAVGMWETGKREPDFKTVNKLSEVFGVSMDYLLGESDEDLLISYQAEISKRHSEQWSINYKKSREELISKLEKFTPEEVTPILSALNITLEYISRESGDTKKGLCHRLNQLILYYGQMLLSSWQMKGDSIKNPWHYLKFLKQYETCVSQLSQHKERLIEKAAEFYDDDEEAKDEFMKMISNT